MTQELPAAHEVGMHDVQTSKLAPGASAAPELGDVVDALDEAASSLKAVVRHQARSVFDDVDSYVRDQPLVALAIAGGVGYLIARLTR
ncbi:hypothetical protein [Dokdonella sp.]|uniref:hypothetical protein n=1 Tax=Dokdonella sp. TaxID=2291710 RepID=UPI003527AB45